MDNGDETRIQPAGSAHSESPLVVSSYPNVALGWGLGRLGGALVYMDVMDLQICPWLAPLP